MKNLAYIFIFLLIGCSREQITEDYSACEPALIAPDNAKAVNGLIEFDIIPDMGYGKSTNKGAAVTSKLWPEGVIPYFFSEDRKYTGPGGEGIMPGFDNEENRDSVRQALAELSKKTGLQFPEYEDQEALRADYNSGVMVDLGFASNSSHVGMQGGIQRLYIVSLPYAPHIKHEFLHAAGLLHEFTRSDRDEYVVVHYDNIYASAHRQYDIYGAGKFEGYDCDDFDFTSLMMYPSFKVAIDTTQPTMTTLTGETWGENIELSRGDIRTIQALYKEEFKNREL